jgi:hypothetical protein
MLGNISPNGQSKNATSIDYAAQAASPFSLIPDSLYDLFFKKKNKGISLRFG